MFQFHMQDRIRFPRPIKFRTVYDMKSHMLIKANGLSILLINIYPFHFLLLYRIHKQLFTYTLTPRYRINK